MKRVTFRVGYNLATKNRNNLGRTLKWTSHQKMSNLAAFHALLAVTPYTKPKEYARSGKQKEPAGAQTIALSLGLWAMEMLVMLRDSFSFKESKVSCTIRSDSLSRAEVALPRDEKTTTARRQSFVALDVVCFHLFAVPCPKAEDV